MFLHISALVVTVYFGLSLKADRKGKISAKANGAPISTMNPIQSNYMGDRVSSPVIPTPIRTKIKVTIMKVTWY